VPEPLANPFDGLSILSADNDLPNAVLIRVLVSELL